MFFRPEIEQYADRKLWVSVGASALQYMAAQCNDDALRLRVVRLRSRKEDMVSVLFHAGILMVDYE